MSTLMRESLSMGSDEDNMGFPYAPEGWSFNDVEGAASEQGISLTGDHWQALRALQEYFARHDEPRPKAREIHDALDELFHRQGGIKYMYVLFPGGPISQGCPLAGIKIPSNAIDESFGSVQ